jgi:NADH:ubiquinone oxidoreductase subunit K
MVFNFLFGNYYFTFNFVVCFVFLSGWVSTYLFRKQFLLSLLSLEFMVLSLFLGFIGTLRVLGKSVSVTIYLLVLGACEATLGLCLLVSFVRLVGSDMLRKVGLVKC